MVSNMKKAILASDGLLIAGGLVHGLSLFDIEVLSMLNGINPMLDTIVLGAVGTSAIVKLVSMFK